MKKLGIAWMVLICMVLTGCVKYKITLTNGTHFTVLGKPKFDEEKEVYRYKSGGKEVTISSGRVRSVEPSSEADSWESPSSGSSTGSSYWDN